MSESEDAPGERPVILWYRRAPSQEAAVHELSMCEAIARTVSGRADGRGVRRVHVRIGHLRQVVPDALMFSWEMLTAGTALDGATLEVEHVPATVFCDVCDAVTTLDQPVLHCGSCGTSDVELRSGDELMLVSFELERSTSGIKAG